MASQRSDRSRRDASMLDTYRTLEDVRLAACRLQSRSGMPAGVTTSGRRGPTHFLSRDLRMLQYRRGQWPMVIHRVNAAPLDLQRQQHAMKHLHFIPPGRVSTRSAT